MSKEENPLTLTQYKRETISKMWAEYQEQRRALDAHIDGLSSGSKRLSEHQPGRVCRSPHYVRINGRNVRVCEDGHGRVVRCPE